jgi:hypothetical protein
MRRKLLIVLGAVILNVLFVLSAMLPEFVTFAEIAPHGVAPNDIAAAAAAGRAQVLTILYSRHIGLYLLAAANVALVLWALKRDER